MSEIPERILQKYEAWKCPGCGILHPSIEKAEECNKKHQWPKYLEVEISQSKESAWQDIEKVGYDSEELAMKVQYAILSVTIKYEFHKNGDVKIVGVEGIPVDGKIMNAGEW